jgi:hypothetical protein
MVMALTRGVGSDIKQGVCPSLNKQSFYSRTLVGSVLLIAFFFLPLHFHSLTPTAQLSQECSCYHGVRTQAGLVPVPADWTPTFQASFVVLHEPQLLGSHSFGSYAIRAPPHGISL